MKIWAMSDKFRHCNFVLMETAYHSRPSLCVITILNYIKQQVHSLFSSVFLWNNLKANRRHIFLSATLLLPVIVSSLYLQSGVAFSSYARGKEKLPPILPRYAM